ncbi:MAG: type II toxin-antitoxin system VapC family toxin [Sulfurovum sp.]|nr:type II toxin-antitoxin system VapC family toxin [Sulfurovum sp.]MCB4764096.1 type II toxin-antitoxin system VapC family toxin [Sulfurovum sp.]MCB4778476.1 type II toxin-antitoxin system VapC family toxin [Sulfurovum sp.]MCB4780892.1 type II toxin-antitoxin system VapC family toxin [Sulfurovum sp.]MCB4782661.1 type II toxin-antitoxin system VapC family toxin [Sulfurovum sp.]
MIYFDTNVLIYYSVNQDENKQKLSAELIEKAIGAKEFYISPLVFSEYIFSLAKLKMIDQSQLRIDFFKEYISDIQYKMSVIDGYAFCREINFYKNINDGIHLKVAEEHCEKLVTFDSDFKKFQKYTELEIEIL